MGPAAKPMLPLVPAPQDEDDVRCWTQRGGAGEGTDLSDHGLERWAEAGEWHEGLA
jgi:hypothetical protein